MAPGRPELHLLCQRRVYHLGLDRPDGEVLSPIGIDSPGRELYTAAQSSLIGSLLLVDYVVSVRFHSLSYFDVDLAPVLGNKLLPPRASRVGRICGVVNVKVRLGLCKLLIDRQVRADEIAVP